MAAELLIYGSIFDFTAELFINQMEEAKDEDITLRINTDGGNVDSSYGMIDKFQSHPGDKVIKVDGKARSMGAFFLCFVDDAECLDVSAFVFHRAALPSFIEEDERFFTPDRKASLEKINKNLRQALEAKVDVPKFEKITKVTMDELFSMEGRVEATLNASQAKQVGLIDRVITITPKNQASINARMEIAAQYSGQSFTPLQIAANKPDKTDTDMDLQKLKLEHPALYAQIMALGVEQGETNERERVGAWMAFADIDIKAVTEGVDSGKACSPKDMAEFTRKGISAEALKGLEEDSADGVDTPPTNNTKEETEDEKKVSAFEAEVKATLKTE